MEKKNPDQFYRIQGDTGNHEFYHRMNDGAGNSKYVFVQVDVRTNPDHTEFFHKSNNRIRLSEALWFPEGQMPSEPYDARSSRIVDMVMNRDLVPKSFGLRGELVRKAWEDMPKSDDWPILAERRPERKVSTHPPHLPILHAIP